MKLFDFGMWTAKPDKKGLKCRKHGEQHSGLSLTFDGVVHNYCAQCLVDKLDYDLSPGLEIIEEDS